jgi:hypothetical protein
MKIIGSLKRKLGRKKLYDFYIKYYEKKAGNNSEELQKKLNGLEKKLQQIIV